MTSMPELVAVFNGFGGAASALVAWGELARNPEIPSFDTTDWYQGLVYSLDS